MIEIKDLYKEYPNGEGIHGITLTIKDKGVYGLLGENGAGKSTTMNIITGYLAATKGTVLINGHDILKDSIEAKKCIGYLPEIPPVYLDMTVLEYLDFAAELKGIKKSDKEQKIDEAIELCKISDVSNRLIKNLSKGYKQRVGLAQAIIGEPDIIILDEPTVGLDPKQIIEIRELIRTLAENHTVILSSHILSEIEEVCDHVIMIEHGKVVLDEDVSNIDESLEDLFLSLTDEEESIEEADE